MTIIKYESILFMQKSHNLSKVHGSPRGEGSSATACINTFCIFVVGICKD